MTVWGVTVSVQDPRVEDHQFCDVHRIYNPFQVGFRAGPRVAECGAANESATGQRHEAAAEGDFDPGLNLKNAELEGRQSKPSCQRRPQPFSHKCVGTLWIAEGLQVGGAGVGLDDGNFGATPIIRAFKAFKSGG